MLMREKSMFWPYTYPLGWSRYRDANPVPTRGEGEWGGWAGLTTVISGTA